VADTFLRRNRRGCEVLSFEISGQTVPAFPVDPEFKDRETLRQLFPEKYRREIASLLKTLKRTVPPTTKEIDEEIARITASAMPAEKKEEKIKHTSSVTMSERDRRERERFGHMEARRGTGRPSNVMDVKSDVGRQALINLVVRQSEKGWIYADEEQGKTGDSSRGDSRMTTDDGAMHIALKRNMLDYSDDDLWMAQVGLWVQKDIIKAINLTNEQVRETASGKQTGVAASAVKRLMNIDVRGFVLGGPADSGATTTMLRYANIDSAKGDKTPPQLTGRACNKLYDVVHYDFTVVIPMRHLLRLQRNLMAQNYHTILEVSIIRPVQSDVHYYGTDSVMKVTIVGEMLMLTDWTRGRWDKETKTWDKDYPPLMPVEDFLKDIRDMNPDALRDEDNKRKGLSPVIETKAKTKTRSPRRRR
ncbi:MAG: hypothetical protein KAV00_02545, partial [Phycisphaerae bacterium]|nr:hypothetical protein [Phycisphaerae bacterium]